MNDLTTAPVEALVVRRHFKASPERVFAAWTQPDLMRQWMAPFDLTVAELTADVRVGGAYRIAMDYPGNPQWVIGGVFVEIDPPRRIAYTWCGQGDSNAGLDTLITIDFHERDGATDVVLTHTKFADVDTRNRHEAGWEGSFQKLDALL